MSDCHHDEMWPIEDYLTSRELEGTRWHAMDAASSMRSVISGLRARGYEARAAALDEIREQWAQACRAPLGAEDA